MFVNSYRTCIASILFYTCRERLSAFCMRSQPVSTGMDARTLSSTPFHVKNNTQNAGKFVIK